MGLVMKKKNVMCYILIMWNNFKRNSVSNVVEMNFKCINIIWNK